MKRFSEDIYEKCRSMAFLESVMKKAHYTPDDLELLQEVLRRILACMKEEAGWSDIPAPVSFGEEDSNGTFVIREVVMTLGAGVDALQEAYLREGKLTEAYMVEVLGSEILLFAYGEYNDFVRDSMPYAVKRYYFLGMEAKEDAQERKSVAGRESYAGPQMKELPDILGRSSLPVTCTEGYCMVPKKSVAFYAELTQDRSVSCEGICIGCGRKDCPNRMDAMAQVTGNRILDHPLTYGYARILGL